METNSVLLLPKQIEKVAQGEFFRRVPVAAEVRHRYPQNTTGLQDEFSPEQADYSCRSDA